MVLLVPSVPQKFFWFIPTPIWTAESLL